MPSHQVGRVNALWRYPVKSMGAEALESVEVGWHGMAGDRRWAFVRDNQVHSDFPWLTIREHPGMRRYMPSFKDPARPDQSPVTVTIPNGQSYDVADPALAAEFGPGVRPIKQNRGVFDTMPLALITTHAVASLGTMVGAVLDVQRFRPNLVLEAFGDEEFPEDAWVGGVLQIGGMRMRVDQRDQRCVMVNIDPLTAERDPAVLRTIARERQACFGVYGSTVEPGRVTIGDAVVLEA